MDNELTEGEHREEDVVGERWEGGTCVLEGERKVSRGNAKEIERCSRRNRAMLQKESCYAARSRAIPQEKSSNAGKSGTFQEEVARFGEKVGCFPNKSPCLRKSFPIFLQPLGGSAGRLRLLVQQVAVIARKVGALARRTGFLE